MSRVRYPEFRDQLEPTKYPFADACSLISQGGQLLEEDLFLDACLHPIGGGERQRIATVTVAPREVTLTIGDRTRRDLASGVFDPLDPPEQVLLADAYGRPAGALVSEPLRLARFGAWETGEHVFALGAAEFVASCVIPAPEPGLRGILDADGNLLTGEIWIVGGDGVAVRDDGDGRIRVDVIGDPLFLRKVCEPLGRFSPPLFIRTINNCPPDALGNYQLTVGDHLAEKTILRINPHGDGLRIEAVGQLTQKEGG